MTKDFRIFAPGCKQCTLLIGDVLFHNMWSSLYIHNTPCIQLITNATRVTWKDEFYGVSVGLTSTKTVDLKKKKKNITELVELKEKEQISSTRAMVL